MQNKRGLLFYWEMTQLVKEHTSPLAVINFIEANFKKHMNYNIFKTSKDEVLQIYDDKICFTVIGGSSADKKEWRSNFNVIGGLKNLFKKKNDRLVDGRIHRGFYNLAMEVLDHEKMIFRNKMIFCGHSRGGAGVSVICSIRGFEGYGFGTPKAFKKIIGKTNFTNVYNPLDFVCHVVPLFKRAGKIVKVRFLRNPHTKYGRILKKKGL